MLKLHILGELHHHSSNVAHGVEVPPGARLLFTNGQVGTKPDGTTPGTTAEPAETRDRFMGDHKPGAIILVVKALARPGLKIEVEAIAARLD